MELNNINLFAQNAAALNKAQGKEEVKAEEKQQQAEVRDNKPAEKQYSADQVFDYMAGSAVAFKAKVNGAERKDAVEARITNFMADFEEAFDFAKELGLSDEAALKILERM
ncbi:MAG: hypothetical protein NC200_08205 [Candidatus Gastranaerophilales bacterium]|nr:hypothetical protein [Candidatus Gastranaerophilales bacterium]